MSNLFIWYLLGCTKWYMNFKFINLVNLGTFGGILRSYNPILRSDSVKLKSFLRRIPILQTLLTDEVNPCPWGLLSIPFGSNHISQGSSRSLKLKNGESYLPFLRVS